jgi:acyl-CoA synthetase (AMP-forming)/AMP-acid ligase II
VNVWLGRPLVWPDQLAKLLENWQIPHVFDHIIPQLSVGIPVPNCEAKLVDLSAPSREVAPGETEEFAVRGPMIFSGYWEKPAETEKAFHDGWFLYRRRGQDG